MKITSILCQLACGTAIILLDVAAAAAQHSTRNCPDVEDQLVIVDQFQPTRFRLRVTDADDSTVGIFQFPLGGALLQPGPTSLDFVFVPAEGFSGSTLFTYRVIPPRDCPRSVRLGRVTLAGGTGEGTAPGLAPTQQQSDCGTSLVILLTPALAFYLPLRIRAARSWRRQAAARLQQ